MGATLTITERRIVEAIAKGMTYQEIGALIGIRERTVRWHCKKIVERFLSDAAPPASWNLRKRIRDHAGELLAA